VEAVLVAVIPKNNKKDMSLPKSHRPIQLIECLGKLVEKIVARRIYFDLGKHELMPFNQFGGRSNSSCLDAGLSLTHDIQTARKKKLVSSFLAVDIKGFFDHVDHTRLLDVLQHKGFPANLVQWVSSFLQDRFVRVQVDDHVGDPHPQTVGVPQGSPVSPVLACIYSSVVLESMNKNPIFYEADHQLIPVGPRGYVDDFGLLAISDDLETNTFLLRKSLTSMVDILTGIGMSIDPDKCDLMHFSWRPKDGNPTLRTDLYGKPLVITPPATIRWLGFHLDRRLTFNHHVSLLATKGKAITSGLKVLGNTVAGISPANLRLLYKTVVIPAITYGSQLWFDPKKPRKKLIRKLEQVQHKALIQIAGAFWDSPVEALQMLTYVPPMTTTLHKLYRSAALRIPRLPLTSEITRRLPPSYLPLNTPIGQRVIPPKHIPFARPKRREVLSPLTRMAETFDSHTERAEPFHTQNAPHHPRLSSDPFRGRLKIEPEACGKKARKSLIAKQRIWLNTRSGRNTLVVVTDGSQTSKAAGWAVTGFHAGRTLFEHKVPLAKRACNHDAEMAALAHASKLVRETMLGELDIREFRIFSDSTAALTSIFDPGPHAAQQFSLTFRRNMTRLFQFRPDITGSMVWTPGHGGLDQMKITDKNARAAANMRCTASDYLLPLFVSRSSALTEVETMALKEWHTFLDNLEDKDEKIFRPQSGFLPFARRRKGSEFLKLRPPNWFKLIKRSSMSALTQMCTNHAPTGEYFKRCVWKYRDKPPTFFHCPCKDQYPPTLQTRDHIIRACPLFEEAREKLRTAFPWIDNPRRSLGGLIKKKKIEDTLEFLKAGAFSRFHAPYEPP
jgi:ribonuclease HI